MHSVRFAELIRLDSMLRSAHADCRPDGRHEPTKLTMASLYLRGSVDTRWSSGA